MKEFWVDFYGYVKIEAKDEIEAEEKFFRFADNVNMPKDFNTAVYDIDMIEEYFKGVY